MEKKARKTREHTDEERAALGDALRRARNAAGFTLEQTALALERAGWGVGKAAVGHWETGTAVPDALVLRKLAKLYGASVGAVLGEAAFSAGAPFRDLTPIEAVILEKIRRAISEPELPGFSLALDQLIEAKRLRPNTTDENEGFSFYFARERRTHSEAVSEERREQWIRGPETGPSRGSRRDQR